LKQTLQNLILVYSIRALWQEKWRERGKILWFA
jgi:hypothetical protein